MVTIKPGIFQKTWKMIENGSLPLEMSFGAKEIVRCWCCCGSTLNAVLPSIVDFMKRRATTRKLSRRLIKSAYFRVVYLFQQFHVCVRGVSFVAWTGAVSRDLEGNGNSNKAETDEPGPQSRTDDWMIWSKWNSERAQSVRFRDSRHVLSASDRPVNKTNMNKFIFTL